MLPSCRSRWSVLRRLGWWSVPVWRWLPWSGTPGWRAPESRRLRRSPRWPALASSRDGGGRCPLRAGSGRGAAVAAAAAEAASEVELDRSPGLPWLATGMSAAASEPVLSADLPGRVPFVARPVVVSRVTVAPVVVSSGGRLVGGCRTGGGHVVSRVGGGGVRVGLRLTGPSRLDRQRRLGRAGVGRSARRARARAGRARAGRARAGRARLVGPCWSGRCSAASGRLAGARRRPERCPAALSRRAALSAGRDRSAARAAGVGATGRVLVGVASVRC